MDDNNFTITYGKLSFWLSYLRYFESMTVSDPKLAVSRSTIAASDLAEAVIKSSTSSKNCDRMPSTIR